MYHAKRFKTVEEALEYFDTLHSDESDISDVDVCIIPPNESGDITENEDINDEDLGEIIPKDVTGELDILRKDETYDAPSTSHIRIEAESTGKSSDDFSTRKKIKLEKTRWSKRKEFNHTFPNEEPSDLKIEFPELNDLDPIQIFHKILPKEYIETLACMTNLYASQKGEMLAIDGTDIAQFLGLLLLSGYHWVPKEDYYWSTAEDLKVDIVPTVMSRYHFRTIKKFFHINDNSKLKSGDKLGKIAPIYEELGKNLRQFGTFHKKLSIDESMVPYYGHHTCKMFIKGKPIRFGFKIWMLCSSSGYPYAMEIYAGRKTESSGMSLGEDVVTQLLSKVADPGRHEIYFDNFFTSYNLLKKLADTGIRATGTVRSNRINQCPLQDNKTLAKENRGAMDYRCDGTVFICRWNDNAVVTVASNHQTHEPITNTKRYSKSAKKKIDVTQPALIKYYNEGMGGVDVLDKLLSSYRPHLRNKKWFWNLFANALNIAATASWIIYRDIHGKNSMTHLEFRRDITMNLLRTKPKLISQPGPKIHVPIEIRKTDNHFLKSTSQGRCAICQKNCRNMCVECDKRLHKACFPSYHGK